LLEIRHGNPDWPDARVGVNFFLTNGDYQY
jgi:hypothetical protein